MNEKDIYKLLNNMDLEEEISEYEDISEIEKEKIKKNVKKDSRFKGRKRKANKYIGVVAASLLLAVAVNTGLPKTIYAKTMTTIDNISLGISDFLNTNNDLDKYSNVVNKTVENDGVSIKLEEVIIDNDKLIIGSLVELEDDSIDSISFDYDIKINGKKVRGNSSSGSIGRIDEGKNVFSDVRHINIEDVITEDNVNMDIEIRKVYLLKENENTSKKLRGRWDYSFTANVDELRKDTERYSINYKFSIADEDYEIKELMINPVNQIIKAEVLGEASGNYDIKLKGHDDLGREVTFDLSSSDGEIITFKYDNYYEDLNLDFERLDLNVYVSEHPKRNGKISDKWEKLEGDIVINR